MLSLLSCFDLKTHTKNNRKRNKNTFSGFEHRHPIFQCKWLSTKKVCYTLNVTQNILIKVTSKSIHVSRGVVYAILLYSGGVVHAIMRQGVVHAIIQLSCKSRSRTCKLHVSRGVVHAIISRGVE